jgi:hypothetical protein
MLTQGKWNPRDLLVHVKEDRNGKMGEKRKMEGGGGENKKVIISVGNLEPREK